MQLHCAGLPHYIPTFPLFGDNEEFPCEMKRLLYKTQHIFIVGTKHGLLYY